jgi:hypothetical protein
LTPIQHSSGGDVKLGTIGSAGITGRNLALMPLKLLFLK